MYRYTSILLPTSLDFVSRNTCSSVDNCRKSAETLPHRTFKLQHTLLETVDLVTVPRNFWHWSVSDIDHRQIGACCACSKCGTFLFAPLMVIVLWPQYREKIAKHMLRAIAVLHFPICALKSCPAPAALAAGAGHYFSLTAYKLTFKPLIVVKA